ncbi:MAG: flavodoxin family protein [Coriobacteriia bacterium]|nr:flavodoxin family protein [Coriobacteriia bacterium]
MAKMIIFTGSPKKKGTTAALLAEVARGAEAAGVDVVEYDLNDKGLRGCQGCLSCRNEKAVACVQNDYFKPMYIDLHDADAIVIGTPIYMGNVTAQTWNLIDRLYPAMGPDFSPRFPGKKFATIVTQGNVNAEGFAPAIEQVQSFLTRLGWDMGGNLVWAGAGGEPSEELKQQAYQIGQELAV